MSNESEKKLERHYGKGEQFEFEGKSYDLELLDIDCAVDYMKVFRSFMKHSGDGKDMSTQAIFEALDDDTVEAAKRLIIKTLELSFPNKEDIGLRNKFKKLKNFFNLFMWVLMNNSDMAGSIDNSKDKRTMDALARVRKEVEDAKSRR